MTASSALCFGLAYGSTLVLFPVGSTVNPVFSLFCLWLFGVFLLAVLLFSATLGKSNYVCLLFTGGMVVLCMLVGIIPAAQRFNPLSLASDSLSLITGAAEASSLYGAAGVAAGLSICFVALAVVVFRKKQL